MSITHVGAVGVRVTDLDRSLEYYTNVLGLSLQKDTAAAGEPGPRMLWIGFPEGRAIVILLPAEPERVGGFTAIVLDADDVRRTHEELSARGAVFARPPQRSEHGWSAILADPDDNHFLLYQPHDERDRH